MNKEVSAAIIAAISKLNDAYAVGEQGVEKYADAVKHLDDATARIAIAREKLVEVATAPQ